MNSNDFYQLAAELNVMDFTKSKPNYTNLTLTIKNKIISINPL